MAQNAAAVLHQRRLLPFRKQIQMISICVEIKNPPQSVGAVLGGAAPLS
jgi:hypothetical protein